ncbi:D-alanyl-D-alanine carboxypeptidase/D-alanyl-D-alanine endopeptidase [Salegentibacter chungangensis]|uniref:D-alanyl-D-alanine carboxypeptidase/D-alanyl-D-alanine-endopeptidase n=1 Tax=Salegentibacter chungangensis TaxID=1335724 RepID=A0ABW3NXU7_9FLAO
MNIKKRLLQHKPGILTGSLLLIFILTSCSSLKRTNNQIDASLEASPVFQQGFAGLAVYDPETNKMLYEYNSGKYFTPASNTKLFTFYTGLKILGDSVPALKFTKVNDSLIFKGTGDPSFLNPDLPESGVIEFLANAKEDLYYLKPVYNEKYFGPGWSWDDYNAYYSVERSAMPIYGNRVDFSFKRSGEIPEIRPELFRDSIVLPEDTETAPGVRRAISKNSFKISNHNKEEEFSRSVPFKTSDELLVSLIEDSIHKDIQIISKIPTGIALDQTLYSIPTDSLYKRMLEKSDNFIAEQILLMAAGKVSDTLKTRIAIDYMKENHLKDLPDKPVWVDGSGLSRYNLFTPRTMVKLLEKIKKEVPQERLFGMMATGGKSGTLENYYKADVPYIFAKTGTLSNNHSLSGLLKTKSGKILIFSFMNSNYTIPTSALKDGMENILKIIRDNY